MEALSKNVFIVTMEVEPQWDAELNRWYDEEHIPNLLKVPGYRSARHYVAVDGAPKYMAFYEMESHANARSAEHEQAVNTPWTGRVRPHYKSKRAFYKQIFPDDGVLRGAAWGDGNTPVNALMVLRVDIAPEHEQDYNAWYDQEHLPALCGVPGVVSARRFKAVEDSSPTYMARYDLVSPEVQTSEAWRGAIDTPWSARVRERFIGRWRAVYRSLPGPS